jgi:hypothetical protein
MSQPYPKVTFCVNCGGRKPPMVTTLQPAPRVAELQPSADALYLMKRYVEALRASSENEMAPPPPLLWPIKEQAPPAPALSAQQRQKEGWMAPPPPALWPLEGQGPGQV